MRDNKNTNVPPSIQHAGVRKWLIGVPDTMATLQWRIRYRSEALKSDTIPEHIRSSTLYCPACGKGQKLSQRCVQCGCAFARYVIMETPVTPGNGQQQRASVSPASMKKERSIRHYLYSTAIDNFTALSLRMRVIAISAALLLAMLVSIGFSQYQRSVQKQYTQNFILALYGIKSGISMTSKVCKGEYNGSKGAVPSDPPASGKIDAQTKADLQTVKTEVDTLMARLETPPAKYGQSLLILRKLYALYGAMHVNITSSPVFLSRCTGDIAAANVEFSRELEHLKAEMPGALTEEFKKAGTKYDLRFMAL